MQVVTERAGIQVVSPYLSNGVCNVILWLSQFLADIFIKVEGDLRRENEGKDHGYSGFKFLVVKKKVGPSMPSLESLKKTSHLLAPVACLP